MPNLKSRKEMIKKGKQIIIVVLLVFNVMTLKAQETVVYDDTNTWFTMLNRFSVNAKWSFSNELHERTGAFFSEHATFLWRPSVDFHLNNSVEMSFGYSYINNEPNPPHKNPKINALENNIWEQILLKHAIGKVNFQHRFRQEHRWFDEIAQNVDGSFSKRGTDYANRFRYRLTLNTPIKKFLNDKELFFQGFDEIWMPQTARLAPKSFSRNWLYLGLGYKFDAKTNLQIGYMNQWDVLGNDAYISTPILQLTFVRNFEL